MKLPKSFRFCRLERLADRAIANYSLLAECDSVLVGVSGGPDSVALLHLLRMRAPSHRLRLGVAHLDHCLRKDSGEHAHFVRDLCRVHGLPYHESKADVRGVQRRFRMSLEEAARQARYQFLRETATGCGYNKVALGHHADDDAETLLLNLLRGSGRHGLAGIATVREGLFIRPMIHAARSDILEYLQVLGLTYLSDGTNSDDRYLRNRIRHRLIPVLENDYQPGVRAVFSRTAEILRTEEEWLESLMKPVLEQVIITRGPGSLEVSADRLADQHRAAARRVVREALRHLHPDLRRIGFAHIEQILNLACRRKDAGPLHLPQGIRVRRLEDRLLLTRPEAGLTFDSNPPKSGDYHYEMWGCSVLTIPETGDAISLREVACEEARDAALCGSLTTFLDWNAVGFPVTVRNFRNGDRFSPLGVGGVQKLKKFFIDHKIPREQRRRCPLLLSGGRIFWVAGHRIDQRAGLTPQTRRVLKAELILAKPPIGT